jgi:PAS domain S-box-containing protein
MDNSSAILRSIIETAIDGIVTIDRYGIVQTINPAAAKLFGYKEQDLIGENVNVLMPAFHRRHHDGYIERYLETGEAKIIGIGREVEGIKKDGSVFPVRLAVSKVETDAGMFFTGILHDLTDLNAAMAEIKVLNKKLKEKVQDRTAELEMVVNRLLKTNRKLESEILEREKAERLLRQSEQELKQSLEAEKELGNLKSRFMSMASHEFKTPLSTILSSTSLVEKYYEIDNLEKANAHLNRIRKSVRHLNGVLNDFLSLSRLDEGKLEPNFMEVDLGELISEIISEMESNIKKDQSIAWVNEVVPCPFSTDKRMMRNVLYNLLSNASKYSEEGDVITTSLRRVGDGSIEIEVKDKGIGIPTEDQKHLFSRFFRSHNVSHIPGTGLGLTIVQRYLALLGGKLSFNSIEGQGSTFTLSFENQ